MLQRKSREPLIKMRYCKYRPAHVIGGWRERRLTLQRGYSTFVLDEFDHHFNRMACDSLRYHLSSECVVDNEERRPVYEDLIRRLAEAPPQPTPEEKAAIPSIPSPGSPRLRKLAQVAAAPSDDRVPTGSPRGVLVMAGAPG